MGAFDFIFGKKATPVQTQPTGFETLPDFGQALGRDIATRGQSLAGSPDAFAPQPFTAGQESALSRLEAGVPTPAIGDFRFGQRSSDAFNQGGDIFSQFAPQLGQAQSDISAGTQAITPEQINSSIQSFTNPFTQQVIDPALADLAQQEARQIGDIGSQASNLGAFGSNRQALENTGARQAALREGGRLSGQLRAQSFGDAASRALEMLTGERNRSLQAGQLGLGALGQIQGGGSAAGNLGTQLMGARQGVQDLRGQVRGQQQDELQDIFSAGQTRRGLAAEEQQIPLQQLELLRNIFGGIPVGGGGSQLRENKGFLSNLSSTASNFGSAATGFGLNR